MFSRWLCSAAVSAVTLTSIPAAVNASDFSAGIVAKGEYLVRAANCEGCHTRTGGDRFAGGVAFNTDFGVIYSTNITPDEETGIGSWTKEDFDGAMRSGQRPGGEHLYPVFPFTAFAQLTEEDISAIFVYLKTVPAVVSQPPQNDLEFPFNQRALMAAWKALFFDAGQFTPDPARSSEWNRGAYLVNALGHCGHCHSPRNALGAEKKNLALTGAVYIDQVRSGQHRPWAAVDLTESPQGLLAWTIDDISQYLKTGVNRYATSFGPMNKVIAHGTRYLAHTDVKAMAVYLKSLPSLAGDAGPQVDEQVFRAGEMLYSVHCATCHLPTGKGSSETGPAMAGNPVVQARNPASLINVILYGPDLPDMPLSVQRTRMDGYDNQLSNDEIAALASYMRRAWGNTGGAVSADQVQKQR